MLAGLAGIGLFSSFVNGILGADANKKQQAVLDKLSSDEQALIDQQKTQEAAKAAQPVELATRTIQEQMNSELQSKNNPFSNPLAISSLGGLRGKLG